MNRHAFRFLGVLSGITAWLTAGGLFLWWLGCPPQVLPMFVLLFALLSAACTLVLRILWEETR